jgi:predicted Zn-dependent protease
VRRTEREADRLAVWLLANAGYDPEAAVQMTQLLRPRGLFVMAAPSHGSTSARVRDIAAEIAALRAAPDANWALRFRREP